MWGKREKILGVIGGMGPEATKLFYEMIIKNTKANCDQDHLNMIIYNHASMPDRTSAILSGETETIIQYLLRDAIRLEENGCAAIAIPCNTSHYFAKQIQEAIHIPFINMIEETAQYVKELNVKKVGILATQGTIASHIYQNALNQGSVAWAIPSKETQAIVNSIIYDDIKSGKGMEYSHILPVLKDLKNQGCDSFILGCTELSVFAEKYSLSQDTFIDAMKILARKCILVCEHPLK